MLRNLRAIATATVTAAALAAASAAVPAHAAGPSDSPTRILMLGDSVTQGSDGDYTWRYFSWRGLQQTGATVDFVGPRVGTNAAAGMFSGGYADPGFDGDHASRWGLSMWEMLNAPSETAPAVDHLVSTYDPDVVVETLGVNDFVWFTLGPDVVAAQLAALVQQARAAKPDVDVVLGSIPQTWIVGATDYNAMLPGLAAAWSTPESQVVAAPAADLVRGVDTSGAHPTTIGQVKIAASVSVALETLGVGHAVSMPLPAVAPDQPRRVRAVRDGRRVIVSWRASTGAERYTVRCGRATRTVRQERAVLRTSVKRCRVRAVGAGGRSPWARSASKHERAILAGGSPWSG